MEATGVATAGTSKARWLIIACSLKVSYISARALSTKLILLIASPIAWSTANKADITSL